MLDQIPASTDWRDTLSRGDIVLFAFPLADDTSGAIPKIRPCAVLNIIDGEDGRSAEIAFGTSADNRANTGFELKLRRPDVIDALNLRRPTRFVCARRVITRLDSPAFALRPTTGSPVLSRMSGAEAERLDRLCELISGGAATRPKRRC